MGESAGRSLHNTTPDVMSGVVVHVVADAEAGDVHIKGIQVEDVFERDFQHIGELLFQGSSTGSLAFVLSHKIPICTLICQIKPACNLQKCLLLFRIGTMV